MKTVTEDYVEKDRKPAWPKGGENPAMRKMYDQLLAEQKPGSSYPVEPRR